MYGIMRFQKLKSTYSLRASLRHSFREQDTPNADQARSGTNQFVGAKSVKDAMSIYQSRLDTVTGKIRKNAVYAVEYMISASPEWFVGKSVQEQNRYFNNAIEWLRSQYGKENVFCYGVHRDETTPHLFAYVIPIKDNKLNAKAYIGGSKHRLEDMQTEFAKKVCEPYGLKRGQEKSKAKHTEIRHWYSVIRDVLDLPKKTTAEKIKMILSGGLDDVIQGAAAAAAQSKQALERVSRYVRAAEKIKSAAVTLEEKLEAAEKHNKALQAENAKLREYQSDYSVLKDLVERNRDLLVQAESAHHGVPLEPIEQKQGGLSAEPLAQRDTTNATTLKM